MDTLERSATLHLCLSCSSPLVQPVEWESAGPGAWSLLLRCPECEVYRTGLFAQEALEALDWEMARGDASLYVAYLEVLEENLLGEIERFVHALEADAVLPEDF